MSKQSPPANVFDQDLVTHQVAMDLCKIQEGIVKISHEAHGYAWLPVTVIRNPRFLAGVTSDNQGVYRISINQDYWEDIFWVDHLFYLNRKK
ncbi:NUDIX hydrolase [Microscilla marina]|uniref:Uncharacterized protein n=1 Tax=Microscilla marina ATCC 23134 TaxID=313606 RepID=A1ZER5_MICM2|nr:hypothetical protein [Microscilla marina]EAY31017.1 hypothetical protein M23134_07424 [Microscilla marina ATCC 23134]